MMVAVGHPYRIREIAVQAGLSEATVDRVLNGRGGVRASTAQEVRRAIADLRRQSEQLRLAGRTFVVDVVVDAPERFRTAVRTALEAELPSLRPATIRSRFHFTDAATTGALAKTIEGVAARGAEGVILKVPDVPRLNAATRKLSRADIPVVTLVTDLPSSERQAYVGIDNRAAGSTAAYLLGKWLGTSEADVMVVRGSGLFRGDDEREMGFRGTMRAGAPTRRLAEVLDPDGIAEHLYRRVLDLLRDDPNITAVYSLYSMSHTAVLRAFGDAGRDCSVYVTHDLDEETDRLLREGHISAVLHHDLRADMRRACHIIMQAKGALAGPTTSRPSTIQVITPYNIPVR